MLEISYDLPEHGQWWVPAGWYIFNKGTGRLTLLTRHCILSLPERSSNWHRLSICWRNKMSELTMPHGNVNRNNRWNNVNEKHDFVFIIHTYFVFVTICSQWVFASVTAHWTSGLSASYTIITISYIAIFNTLIDRVTLKWPRLYFKIKQVILYPLSLSFILK